MGGCEAQFWFHRPWSYGGTGGTGELNGLLFPLFLCTKSDVWFPEACSETR